MERLWQWLMFVYLRVVVALFVFCAGVFSIYSMFGVVVFLDAASLGERLLGLAVFGMAVAYGYFAWQLGKTRIQALPRTAGSVGTQ